MACSQRTGSSLNRTRSPTSSSAPHARLTGEFQTAMSTPSAVDQGMPHAREGAIPPRSFCSDRWLVAKHWSVSGADWGSLSAANVVTACAVSAVYADRSKTVSCGRRGNDSSLVSR